MLVHTGDYIEQTSTASSRANYYTFTPRPLMDGGFYTMDDDLASLLAGTHKAIGVLEGVLQASEHLQIPFNAVSRHHILFEMSVNS